MALPKPPKKGRGRPLKKVKPTAAELAGIRKRSAASHGGKSLGEGAVMRTWEKNQARKQLKAGQKAVQKRTGGRTFAAPDIEAMRAAGGRKRTPTASQTQMAARKPFASVPAGYTAPGKSGSAPGRARGNPTPGLKKPKMATGPRPKIGVPGWARPAAPAPAKPPRQGSATPAPKLGFPEKRPTGRIELPKPRNKKRVGS